MLILFFFSAGTHFPNRYFSHLSREKFAAMSMLKKNLTILFLVSLQYGYAQTVENVQQPPFPQRLTYQFLNDVSGKFSKLQQDITKKTSHMLDRMEKQEAKLCRKLQQIDSAAARKLFASNAAKYAQLRNKLRAADSGNTKLKEYLPHFDTLSTSLAFLEKGATSNPQLKKELADAKAQLQLFGNKMQVVDEIKKQIRERKQQLNEQLQQLGMDKQLMAINKQVYYYQAQLNEYKEMLHDTKKMEQKVLAILNSTPSFKSFFEQNGQLSRLFPSSSTAATVAPSLLGFQSRFSIQQAMTARIGSSSLPQQFSQQLSKGLDILGTAKGQLNKLASGNSNDMMPTGFVPNSQKVKKFLRRLEYSFNLQTQTSNRLLPVTSDIGFSIGYKLNDASVFGIGTNYKLGWGKKITDFSFTNQGVGFRTYLDIKLKKQWWISGGYELNYFSEYRKLEDIAKLNAWQRGGLIGLCRKYKIANKKTAKMQVLYDLLYQQQRPWGSPIVFRFGWTL